MKKYNYFFLIFYVFSQLLYSQQKNERGFSEIRKTYEKMDIDNIRAMSEVRLYIQKAKKESNFPKLIQGYRDARQFDFNNKMKYADSAINVSLKYGSRDDISKDYLSKGIIYYFYQKKYKFALDEYLQAYRYSKGSKDEYHRYKVIYHMGIVKAYLGYYEEALEHFRNCISYFRSKSKERLHDNEKFNYKKAYFNSLHQMTVVSRYLKDFNKSDSLGKVGYDLTLNDNDFDLENSYFLKCIGISKFNQKNYSGAKTDLEQSLPIIIKRNDFAWTSVIYYYLGRIYHEQNNSEKAILYFNKIDSIFQRQGFILPEVYESYNYLIDHYKKTDINKQLYYTGQLLKADSLIAKDYTYLSSRLREDYDRITFLDEKEAFEKSTREKNRIAQLLIIAGALIMILLIIRYKRGHKIKNQYGLLQQRLTMSRYKEAVADEDERLELPLRKTYLTPEITVEIREKLHKFEKEFQFTKKGLTQKSVAVKLGTNSHYLSVYINENKGMNFNKYMAALRINYITNLLNTNTKYLNYRIEALADECGIAARQNFSNLFFEINGIRPTDYIKQRKKDLGLS